MAALPLAAIGQPVSPAPTPVPALPAVGGADVARMVVPAASAAAGVVEPDDWTARGLVQMFTEACLAGEAQVQLVDDWAINRGFVPLDASDPGARALLDDRPGSVLSPAGLEGRVMLAVVDRAHCIVWSDRAGGPSLRLALLQALGERRARGETAELTLDRRIERAGAWRQQTQWRWRRPGASGEWGIGLVHTLTDTPAAQVLRLALVVPLPATLSSPGPVVAPAR